MRPEVLDAFRIIFSPKCGGQQLVNGLRVPVPVGNFTQVDRSRMHPTGSRYWQALLVMTICLPH